MAFNLTVNGSSFLPTSQVEWNGLPRTTTFLSGTQLQAAIMAPDLAAAGNVAVTVVNPTPGGGTSNAATFAVVADTIAFDSGRALNGADAANSAINVWVMNSDGTGQTALTKLTAAGSFLPAMSPDGTKMVFVSNRALDGSDNANTNSTSNIWIMNADGSGAAPLTRLTTNAAAIDFVVWSPDSTKLAYASARALDGTDSANTTSNVWTSSLSGTDTPLTTLKASGAGMAGFPIELFWTPGESRIIFASFRNIDDTDSANPNSTANIWATNSDGSGATPLTKLQAPGADNQHPSQP